MIFLIGFLVVVVFSRLIVVAIYDTKEYPTITTFDIDGVWIDESNTSRLDIDFSNILIIEKDNVKHLSITGTIARRYNIQTFSDDYKHNASDKGYISNETIKLKENLFYYSMFVRKYNIIYNITHIYITNSKKLIQLFT